MIAYIDSYITEVTFLVLLLFFGRGHATIPCSVGRSVGRYVYTSIHHIFEFQAEFALLLLLEFTYMLFYTPPLPEVADETQKRIWR